MTPAGEVSSLALHIAHSLNAVETRRDYRPRVLKGGTIIYGTWNSEITCTLRNQHAGGAELAISVEAMIPAEFLLYVPADRIGYRSLLCWRHLERVGVQFLGIEPKPPHHYG